MSFGEKSYCSLIVLNLGIPGYIIALGKYTTYTMSHTHSIALGKYTIFGPPQT